jgi:hypothetical protein
MRVQVPPPGPSFPPTGGLRTGLCDCRTSLQHLKTEIRKGRAETGAENTPNRGGEFRQWPGRDSARQTNPRECRRFSHAGKSARRDGTCWLRMQVRPVRSGSLLISLSLLRQEQNSGRIWFCLLSICARCCCHNEEQETLQRDLGKSEQSRGSDPRSVPEAAEFGPDHVWSDTTPSCRRVEAAIGRGQHFRRITDYRRHPFNSV